MRGRNTADMSLADSLSCSPPQLLYCVGLTLQSASADCHTWSLCLATAFRFGSLPNPASGPFGSPLPASLRFCLAYAGPIHAAFPLPDADLDFPDRYSAFAPLWDVSRRFNASADSNQRGSPSPATRFPFAPRCWLRFTIARFGSSFPVRLRLLGLLFLLTSWNLLHNALEAFWSQSLHSREWGFSSG
jgi:hypothetical protein